MPELPEVETIRRGLERLIVGYTISDVDVRYAPLFTGNPKDIIDAEITAVKRYGKGLLIELHNGLSIAIHVKMTGQLIFKSTRTTREFHPRLPMPVNLPDKHTHVIFKLIRPLDSIMHHKMQHSAQGKKKKALDTFDTLDTCDAFLYYNDIRKFGWMKVVPTKEALQLPFFKTLGLEPFVNLAIEPLSHIIQSSSAPIKSLLMNQQKIAGIGNIYANDALFAAGIDPRRKANTLTQIEIQKLFTSIETVLQKGIEAGGASDVNYVNAEGGKGSYQNHFLVYRKDGKPCPRCGTPIERIKLAGRGTFYCPKCQQ